MKFPGSVGRRDWSLPITGGPTERGFDEFFGIPASWQRRQEKSRQRTIAVSRRRALRHSTPPLIAHPTIS